MKPFDWLSYSRLALRRASYRTPARNAALTKARVARGLYECAECKRRGLIVQHPKKTIALDHIIPVVDPKLGWISLDDFAQKLLCDESNYQVLCKPHHQEKTNLERHVRAMHGTLKRKKKNVPQRPKD